MMKMEKGAKTYFEWIKENIPKGSKIGVDENLFPCASFKTRGEYFEKEGITLVGVKGNLVD